jgi:hypothetical protein
MSITVGVDSVTFNIVRVLTAVSIGGIGGLAMLLAGEKFRISSRLLRPLIAVSALGTGLGAFLAAWASIKLSLCFGIGIMILGASLAFEKGAMKKGVARWGGAIALLAAGASWLAWNSYLMFR